MEYITYLPIFVVPPPIPKNIKDSGTNISNDRLLLSFLNIKYTYGETAKIIGNNAFDIPFGLIKIFFSLTKPSEKNVL